MSKHILLLVAAIFLVSPSVAQGQTTPYSSVGKAVAPKKKSTSRRKQPKETASARRRFWVTMALTSAFDSNIEDDQQGLNSFGLVPSIGLNFQDNSEKPSFEASYEVALHRYTNTRKYDRVSQYLTASYRRELSRKLQLRTIGEISLKGSSEDRDVNNQYSLEQQLQYRFNSNNRLRLFGAYRLKRYPLEDRGKNAIDPYIGARFEQRLGRGRSWEVLYRYDKNRSLDPKDRYVRRTFGAEFVTPLFREGQDLLTFDVRYAPRLYSRQVKVEGARVPRRDQRWTFDLLYERPLSEDVRMGLNYRYETRNSNDPEKIFNSHLFALTFSYRWWR